MKELDFSSSSEEHQGTLQLQEQYEPLVIIDATESLKINNISQHTEENTTHTQTERDIKQFVISILVGFGTGFAMMPIFNREVRNLESFNFDIHSSDSAFFISTANTLLVYSYLATKNTYYCLEKNFDLSTLLEEQSLILKFAKVCAILTAIMPASLLWEVELHNREVVHSEDILDEYVMYAFFTSIPLIYYYTLKSFYSLEKMLLNKKESTKLNSIGSKIVVYGITSLAFIGNEIVYIDSANKFSNDSFLNVIATTFASIGGVIATYVEFNVLKKLFKADEAEYTKLEIIKGLLAVTEASWFTLPIISAGLKITESIHSLFKIAVFSSLFLAHTALDTLAFFKKR